MHIFRRSGRIVAAGLLTLGLFLTMVGIASAHSTHAKVLTAVPAIGATVPLAPTSVLVNTAENMKPGPAFSNLFVYSPAGDLVSQGNATVSLSNPKQMSISIKPTGGGIYVVRWVTVSADDGDPDQGAFVFTVKAGVSISPAPSNSGTTNNSSVTTTGTNGTPIWVPILAGILALLVGLGVGFGLGRRRPAPASSGIGAMRRSVAAQMKEEELPTKRP